MSEVSVALQASEVNVALTLTGGGGGSITSVNTQTGVVVLDQDDVADGTTYKQYSATDKTKLAGIETAADVTDATNVDAAGATMNTDTSLAGNGYFLDEDNMVSDSALKVPSQQSVKAYVDTTSAAKVSDTAYGASWDTVTTIAPSKNAVYDEINSIPVLEGGTRTSIDLSHAGFVSIDVSLSTGVAGGDTLAFGSGSGDDGVITSTTHATKGTITIGTSIYDEVNNWLGIGMTPTMPLDVTGTASISTSLTTPIVYGSSSSGGSFTMQASSNVTNMGQISILAADPTYTTTTPSALFGLSSSRTITANVAGQRMPSTFLFNETRIMTTVGNAGTNPNFVLDASFTYKNANPTGVAGAGTAAHLSASASGVSTTMFFDRVTAQADGATINLGHHISFRAGPTFNTINSGTLQNGIYTGVRITATVASGATVGTMTGYAYIAPTVGGTLTTQLAIDIPNLTQAGTNIGIRNASSYVATPSTTQTISAAGNTILANAHLVRISNSTGGSITLTSNPTIADGQSGQILIVQQIGADDVVLTNGNNLRLPGAANLTLGQWDTITLVWDTTDSQWIAITPLANN